MKEQLIKVRVRNWEKFNGGKKKGHPCIMVATNLCDHPKLLSVPIKARLLYFWLLMECGDQLQASVEFLPSQTQNWCGFGSNMTRDCRMAVESLEQIQLLTIENRELLIEKKRKESNSGPEKIQQPLASQEFNFETIAKEWPIKAGRSLGLKRLRSREWDLKTCNDFARACRKYASECRMQRKDQKFIKHFSTFVGTVEPYAWRDYHEAEKPVAALAAVAPINEPSFDPVDTGTIVNPHARKLLNLVTNGVGVDETRRPHG